MRQEIEFSLYDMIDISNRMGKDWDISERLIKPVLELCDKVSNKYITLRSGHSIYRFTAVGGCLVLDINQDELVRMKLQSKDAQEKIDKLTKEKGEEMKKCKKEDIDKVTNKFDEKIKKVMEESGKDGEEYNKAVEAFDEEIFKIPQIAAKLIEVFGPVLHSFLVPSPMIPSQPEARKAEAPKPEAKPEAPKAETEHMVPPYEDRKSFAETARDNMNEVLKKFDTNKQKDFGIVLALRMVTVENLMKTNNSTFWQIIQWNADVAKGIIKEEEIYAKSCAIATHFLRASDAHLSEELVGQISKDFGNRMVEIHYEEQRKAA
jgi:hypothetical protein